MFLLAALQVDLGTIFTLPCHCIFMCTVGSENVTPTPVDSDHFYPSISHCIFKCIVGSENVLQFHGKARKSFPLNKVIYRGINEFDNKGKIFQQIFDAINFVHKAGWLHNDIKENNVLMHKTLMEWKPVATDLERAHHAQTPNSINHQTFREIFTSVITHGLYLSLYGGTHNQLPASDVYSLGVFLRNMLSKFVQQNHCLESLSRKYLVHCPDLQKT